MSSKLIWTCDACGHSEEFTEGDASEIPGHWQQGVLMRKDQQTGQWEPQWEDLCPDCRAD